ncbi:acyl-CoA dehydrogenase, partial [Pseudomonas sp. 3A(2025)]
MNSALAVFLKQHPLLRAGTAELSVCLQALVTEGLDRLPLPGAGATLARWQALACVAGHDLGLCKLYEGHTDALAIMTELGAPPVADGSTWGMWAAEPPQARVRVSGNGDTLRLDGLKAWCSGATVLSHALLTAWDEQDRQQLVAVALEQPGVHVTDDGWCAVGMGATASVEVRFEQAMAWRVGEPGAYLQRQGFWQGAIGIAACWYGAAQALALHLPRQLARREEPHALAHLGAVDAALYSAARGV